MGESAIPYVLNPLDGVRIYYETVGVGPPLLMYYGALRAIPDWYELGFVDALSDQCQLILVDPRSHGKSDGPHHPDSYTSQHHSQDAIAVLDDLGIEKTNCLGYSMGGRICYGILRDAPERLKAMIIGGQHTGNIDEIADQVIASVAHGMDAMLDHLDGRGIHVPESQQIRIRAMDPPAVTAMSVGIKNEKDLGSDLTKVTIPCLLYAGSEDPWLPDVQATAEKILGCEFKVLEGLDHRQGAERADLVAPVVTEFISRQGQKL